MIVKTREGFYHATGKCIFTGAEYTTAEFPAHQLFKYNQGVHVQDAFPNLSADDREFIISGISPDGWKQTFGEDEDEDN